MSSTHKKGDKIMLEATKREIFGKKLGPLRKEGKLPANIFGHNFTSTAITVDAVAFLNAFRHAGETQVIYVQLDKDTIPVLVADMHLDPRTDTIIHADLRRINLREKTEVQVPLVFTGEPIAVAQKLGDLLTLLDEVTIEALPADMPSEIEVDVTDLAEVDAEIRIADLKLPAGCAIHEDPEELVAKIAEHKEEDLTPATEEEQPAADTATTDEASAESAE